MRTIKFRGKSLFSGEWVYGGITVQKDGWSSAITQLTEDEFDTQTLVMPDTIGQFTGLYDKNGKEIYEGDILKSPKGNIVAVEFGYKEHVVKHGRPQVTDNFACYGWIARNVKNGSTDFLDNEFLGGEIIGNIHDNPELLTKSNYEENHV